MPSAGIHRREAKGVSSEIVAPVARRTENICQGCGKTIHGKSVSCARCAVSDATKNMLNVARVGRQTANSPKARLKRANTLRKNTLAQQSWKPSDQPAWLTEEFYMTKIQPVLASTSASAIARRISVSRCYAGRIRKGYRPHPRHWKILADLAGAMVS